MHNNWNYGHHKAPQPLSSPVLPDFHHTLVFTLPHLVTFRWDSLISNVWHMATTADILDIRQHFVPCSVISSVCHRSWHLQLWLLSVCTRLAGWELQLLQTHWHLHVQPGPAVQREGPVCVRGLWVHPARGLWAYLWQMSHLPGRLHHEEVSLHTQSCHIMYPGATWYKPRAWSMFCLLKGSVWSVSTSRGADCSKTTPALGSARMRSCLSMN